MQKVKKIYNLTINDFQHISYMQFVSYCQFVLVS